MFGNRASRRSGKPAWHAHAGDAIEDPANVPGIVAFLIGIGGVAATITAAGYGFPGWAGVGAAISAILLIFGITVVVVEHEREKSTERKSGRHGHNPLA